MSDERPLWRAEHRDLNVKSVRGRRFQRELFVNCTIQEVRGAVFEHCAMVGSKLDPQSLTDILGFTATLDCLMFEGWEWNELAMDAMLYLLSLTKGNDERRDVLRRMVRPESMGDFDKLFSKLECFTK